MTPKRRFWRRSPRTIAAQRRQNPGKSGGDDAFETRAVHAGQAPDPATGAVVPPISLASTFVQDAVGTHRGYEYARSSNPTRAALEACVAELEGAPHGLAFASGMAAEDAVLRAVLRPGDHVIIPADAYGGTYRLLARVFEPAGVTWSAVDHVDLGALAGAWRDETKILWVETPTNPLLTVIDIAAVAGLAHERGARVVVDNTFATPYLQQPLDLGADVVVHSATKYLAGHDDVLLGAVVCLSEDDAARLREFRTISGIVAAPDPCWLLLRSLETLPLRVERQTETARELARRLEGHAAVGIVRYPGFGGLMSFDVADGDAARRVETATRVITNATSLGGVRSVMESRRRWEGDRVPSGLLRLSVGLEDVDAIWEDLERALAYA
jgi:cystathionine gamma-synthase